MELDLIVRGGLVVDGTATAVPELLDVGVRGDRIAALGRLDGSTAASEIDATGRVVAPGFVDPHVHSEAALRGGADRFGALLQGVTTHLTGADGFGWAGLAADAALELWRSTKFAYGMPDFRPDWPTAAAYLDSFGTALPLNVAVLAPHQAIRFGALGWDPRPPTTGELRAMLDMTRSWLDAGAVGLATGLDYQPAASATTDEVAALCEVVAERGGVYATHQRYADRGRIGALAESIEIGRRTGIRVAVAHESVDDETEPLLDAATDVDITLDWYLYPAGCTHFLAMLPLSEVVGGPDALLERLRDPAVRSRIAALLEAELRRMAAEGARAWFADTRTGRHIGRSVDEIAAAEERPLGEMAVRLLVEEAPEAVLIYRRGTPDDEFAAIARRTLAWPHFMVASDGLYHGALPHPRGFGCFARVLGEFVRRERAIDLATAVHKLSGLAAERYGLGDRGRVAVGSAADLVVFDPATVDGPASWDAPRTPPTGIEAVVLNGTLVVRHGQPTGTLAGRVLRRH